MYHVFNKPNNTTIYFSENKSYDDSLNVIEVGHSYPVRGYTTLRMRNCHIIHYVVSGTGTYFNSFPVKGPCGFLMTPDHLQTFHADESESSPPFEHYWIMLTGNSVKPLLESCGFITVPHVFDVPYMNSAVDILKALQNPANYLRETDILFMTSQLYRLLSLHSASLAETKESSGRKTGLQYVNRAMAFIESSYGLDIREKDIADAVHISTKYLYRIFKRHTSRSPMVCLNSYRIHRARRLLEDESLQIKEIAAAVGIPDADYFCRVFQKYTDGLSPTEYRKIGK